jgi:uncharacterized membrane protein SpoIIM required for sporulation
MSGPIILSVLVIVIAVVISLITGYYMKTKNQERLRMIDKGINPDGDLSISEYRKQTNLKNGILFISLGIGLLIGHILVITIDKLDNFLPYLTMLLIFGGIGFLINYSIIKRSSDK